MTPGSTSPEECTPKAAATFDRPAFAASALKRSTCASTIAFAMPLSMW